jgi:hypothetical protein
MNTQDNRKKAIAILNAHIQRLVGLHIDDLPDTYDICNVIDELEEALNEDPKNPQINVILFMVNMDFIEGLIYG